MGGFSIMADNRVGVSLVGESAVAARIHELLPRDKFRIRAYLGRKSSLRRSRFIDDSIAVGNGPRASLQDLVSASAEGQIEPDNWIVWGSDQALEAIRSSRMSIEQKLALLPVRTTAGLATLGSKVGLVALCEAHGIDIPTSTIALTQVELERALSLHSRVLIKGDSGNSGSRILPAVPRSTLRELAVPDDWYPVVVQEFVEGPMVSVEALFREGMLSHSLYSIVVAVAQQFGLTRVRHFQQAPSADYLTSLKTLGEVAGLHGFANCSFIWDAERQRHVLFEVDMRPNRWHQFGPVLGVNWAEGLFQGPTERGTAPGKQHEAVIRHFPREIVEGLKRREWSWLVPWLTNQPGTWDWRQTADSLVNRQEWRSIARAIVSPSARQ
jgi:hypothetical protein